MAWDFWKKGNHNPFRGGFASRGTGKLYRNPFTGELTTERQDTSSDGYRRGWEKNGCNTSGDCGSGHACIDGQCVKVWTRNGSNYKPNTCGDQEVTWAPCKKGNTDGGSNSQCGRATPGNCERDPVCPGTKCCRQQGDGSIRCVCGPCEQTDTNRCNSYCDSYYKSFGEVSTGCYTRDMDGFGECGGNICDECKYCSIHSSTCAAPADEFDANFNNLPCHCGGCDENCHQCDTNPESSTFGDCIYTPENCSECCTQFNYDCPQCANKYIPNGHLCQPVTSPKPCITALREKLYKQCAEACSTEPDPCAPTGSFTFCEDGMPDYSNFTSFSMNLLPEGTCPEGKICENTGNIQVNGQTCWIISTWNKGEIPSECEQCDCNCHNDCKTCELCNAQGECEPDPACEVTAYTMKLWSTETGHYYGYSGPPTIINCGTLDPTPSLRKTYINVAPEDVEKYTIQTQTTPYTDTTSAVCCSCQENEGANDQCLDTCPCPGTVTIKYAYINGVQVPYIFKQVAGCKIFRPQGGITTWLFTSGDLWWEAVPQI